jgi:hypothetical protein
VTPERVANANAHTERFVCLDQALDQNPLRRIATDVRVLQRHHGVLENVQIDHRHSLVRHRRIFQVKDPRFRTSGLRLTPVPEGVRGLAYLRDSGGHYEDLYVKTPQGWRIKERKHFPLAAH